MKTLQLRNLGKTFPVGRDGGLTVLQGINADISSGSTTSICGSSGCGKTTLLNIIGGLARPGEGEVLCDGEDIHGFNRSKLARWRSREVGFVFQSYHLMPELDVLENVLLPAAFLRQDRRREAESLLAQVGLAGRMKHRPSELSGGEQQRAATARALINDPGLILADEPTGNLDRANREQVLHLLLDLTAQSKKALILVTHDEAVAARMSVRYRLVDGRLERVDS